jgi:hypothetical protein
MKPPKCRTCGKEEWHHVCGPKRVIVGAAKPKKSAPKKEKPKRRAYHRKYYDSTRRGKLGHKKRGVERVENGTAQTHNA